MTRAFGATRSTVGILAVTLLTATILYAMGRTPICECGTIKLWHADAFSSEASQHLSDWYTPSHIIHGFIFYGFLALLARWLAPLQPVGLRAILAAFIEAAWEVLENSPIIIDRYREATAALGYTGDSIINSIADIGWMLLGFWFAWKMPWWVTVIVAIVFELVALAVIRDNLTLNVIMLVYPIEAIKTWQLGG